MGGGTVLPMAHRERGSCSDLLDFCGMQPDQFCVQLESGEGNEGEDAGGNGKCLYRSSLDRYNIQSVCLADTGQRPPLADGLDSLRWPLPASRLAIPIA